MTREELNKISTLPSSAIIAPAGHGKTEMIVDIVEYLDGKQLLLTHTNAGVDAIKKRLQKRKIPKEKYSVATIASFCIKWCTSYYGTGNFDMTISPLNGKKDATRYYEQLYRGTKRIFESSWAGCVLKSSFSGIIVDEYQDCIQEQHEIILTINKFLPVRILGDPMQGIFSFAGNLVEWNEIEFPVVEVSTKPWRWSQSNPELGKYLKEVRKALLPTLSGEKCRLQIRPNNKNVVVVSPDDFTGYSHLNELSQFKSVVYITKWPAQQLDFCAHMSGIFQYDEKQDCDELFKYAKLFDSKQDADLIIEAISFAATCSTGVNKELNSYIRRLKNNSFNFSHIKKHMDFREIIEESMPNISLNTILKIFIWFSTNSTFKKYRTELLAEMIRSLKYAIEHDIEVFDAANQIRKNQKLQKRYTGFKFLSSRTLLSKGLEFDCVIIDMKTPLSARDFYVAMTRAMKKIYIISDTNLFIFTPN